MTLGYKITAGICLSALLYIGYLKIENYRLDAVIIEQRDRIGQLSDDKLRLEQIVSTKNDALDQWREVYEEQSLYRKALQTELDTKTKQMRRYKDRQDVVFKKPGLVQLKEQKALDKFFDEVRDEK